MRAKAPIDAPLLTFHRDDVNEQLFHLKENLTNIDLFL